MKIQLISFFGIQLKQYSEKSYNTLCIFDNRKVIFQYSILLHKEHIKEDKIKQGNQKDGKYTIGITKIKNKTKKNVKKTQWRKQ